MRSFCFLLLAVVFAVATANAFAKPVVEARLVVGAFSLGVGLFVLGKMLRRM